MSKIRIRFAGQKDVKWIQQYASDKRISNTSNVPYPYPENGAQEFIDFAIKEKEALNSIVFTICLAEQFAGLVTLNRLDAYTRTCSIDYWIAVPFWGKGIGTKAVRQAIEQARKTYGIKTIYSGGLKRNIGTNCILKKNGFEKINEKVQAFGKFEGELICNYKREL